MRVTFSFFRMESCDIDLICLFLLHDANAPHNSDPLYKLNPSLIFIFLSYLISYYTFSYLINIYHQLFPIGAAPYNFDPHCGYHCCTIVSCFLPLSLILSYLYLMSSNLLSYLIWSFHKLSYLILSFWCIT